MNLNSNFWNAIISSSSSEFTGCRIEIESSVSRSLYYKVFFIMKLQWLCEYPGRRCRSDRGRDAQSDGRSLKPSDWPWTSPPSQGSGGRSPPDGAQIPLPIRWDPRREPFSGRPEDVAGLSPKPRSKDIFPNSLSQRYTRYQTQSHSWLRLVQNVLFCLKHKTKSLNNMLNSYQNFSRQEFSHAH